MAPSHCPTPFHVEPVRLLSCPSDGTWKQSIPSNGKHGFAGRSFFFFEGGGREPEGNLRVGLGQLLDYRKRANYPYFDLFFGGPR